MTRPKIVYWDLETIPIPSEVYKRVPSFGAWPGRGFSSDIQAIMSFGYKFEGDTEASCINLWDYYNWNANLNDFDNFFDWEKFRFDDRLLLEDALDILSSADEIVTHNGKNFDEKMFNGRLAKHALGVLPKIHHVDTKRVAKKLKLYSNRLDDVAKHLNCETKLDNGGWDQWVKMAFGAETSVDQELMSNYCKQDVDVLQQVHNKTRPYHGNASVNKNLFNGEIPVCSTCGSAHLLSNGYRSTSTKRYKRMQCQECGTWNKFNIKETKVTAL